MMSAHVICVFDQAPANGSQNRIWGAPDQSDEPLNVVFSGPDGRHCIAAPTPPEGASN